MTTNRSTNSPRSGGASKEATKSKGSAKAEVKAKAAELKDEVKDQAAALKGKAQQEAKGRIKEGKSKATGVLDDVSSALHETGDALQNNDQDAFARYANTAANQLDEFVEAVRDRSVGELFDEAERFARRDPGLFVGGAFLLGIFGARFLKASATAGPNAESRSSGTGGSRSMPTSDWRGSGAGVTAGRSYGVSSASAPPVRSSAT